MKIELLLNSAPIKQTYCKGGERRAAGRELYIGGGEDGFRKWFEKSFFNQPKQVCGARAGSGKLRGSLSVSATQTL